jgi:ubiquinone/menaquinone biosynthesis C-methylase UbiE
MSLGIFSKGVPEDFKNSINLPNTEEQARKWQASNKSWWENNPMRYDITEKIPYKEYSKEFYEEIDKRFFQSVWQIMPWQKLPFDNLIDFDSLHEKDVLEIGVGCGSHAQLLAQHARSYRGIDITDFAVKCTRLRLSCFGINGSVLCMDAEKLNFPDNSFDFIWSWGVIHHSSNTRKILEEIFRVLRPGGKVITMVYHRSFWHRYVRGALYYGILRRNFFKSKSLNRIIQETTDGALARFYSLSEWNKLLSDLFVVEKNSVLGSKSQLIPLAHGRAKEFLMSLIPNGVGRFITNRPLFGWLLITSFKKK